jgi:hypothetical protein
MNHKQNFLVLTSSFITLAAIQGQTIQYNIQVNADSENDHNETTIAINPLDENNLVAGSFYFTGQGKTEVKHLAYYYSLDGGLTWGEGFLPVGGQYANIADPVVSFDAKGRVYYVHISNDGDLACTGPWADNALFVNRSTDGGLSWLSSPLVVAQNGDGTTQACTQPHFEDKPWIACDALGSSPYKNNVYVAWARFYTANDRQIMFSRRPANQQQSSFDPPITLNGVNTSSNGPAIAVGTGGIVYVAWFEANAIKVSMSTDGGISFSPLPDAATGIVPLEQVSGRRANSFPAIAVDNSGGPWDGYIHIVWADLVNGNPDIYWVYGIPIPGGVEWQPENVIHSASTADQWFPAITVDPNGIAHVAYYDKRNHGIGDVTDVYVAAAAPIGIWEAQVNTQSFNVTYDRNLFLGDYIGIAASSTRIFPFWTDTRNAGGPTQQREDVYVGIVDQRTVDVTLDQLVDGQSSDSVGRWENNQFVNYPAGGPPIPMVFGSREVLKGLQEVVPIGSEEQKYNRWNSDTEVENHHEFIIDGTDRYTSNFEPTASGITVRNNLVDAPGNPSGDSIQFRDPWLIDFDDPPYGLRNRGQVDAVFRTVASPFNPTTTPGLPGSAYKGVFLNKPATGTNPHYRLNALATPLPGFTWYFLGWEHDPLFADVNPDQQNPNEAAVVFLQDGAVVSAKYKGHLASSIQTAGGPSGQRKAVSFSGTSHSVYASGGSIWYTKRQGSSWSTEVLLSPGSTTAKNPSIASTYIAPDIHLHVVWEETFEDLSGTEFQGVVYQRSTDGGTTWQGGLSLIAVDGAWGAYGEDATPVIAASGSNVVIVWKYDDFYGAGLAWKANPADWPNVPIGQIRYTDDLRKSPSLEGQTTFKLAYEMSGKVWFDEFSLGSGCGPTSCALSYVGGGPVDLSSIYTWMSSCANPSVTSRQGFAADTVYVSWDAITSIGGNRNAYIRERTSSGWQPVREFGSSVEDKNTTVGLDPRTNYRNVLLLWERSSAIAKVSRPFFGTNWSSVSNLGAGYSPSVTNINLNNLIPWGLWAKGSAVPYQVRLMDVSGPPQLGMIAQRLPVSGESELQVSVSRRAAVRLDSLNLGGLGQGAVIGDLIIESPSFEIVSATARDPVEFTPDGADLTDWMWTMPFLVPTTADSLSGAATLTLQGFQVVDPRVPLTTPVLTVTACLDIG